MNTLKELEQRICEPTPEFSSNPAERLIQAIRNKWTLRLYFIYFVMVSKFMYALKEDISLLYLYMLAFFIDLFVFLKFLKTRPLIPKIVRVCLTVFGFTYINTLNSISYRLSLFFMTYCFAANILLQTGSHIFSLVASLGLHYILQGNLKEFLSDAIVEYGHEKFLDKLFVMSNESYTLYLFGLLFLHKLMINIQRQVQKMSYSKEVAEKTLQNQKNFLFSFSHEMRNPLNSLMGNLQAALFENLPPKVVDLLHTAEVCGEFLLQMINNILDSGKMELEGLEVNYKPTNVHEVLEKIWAISSEMIKKKGLFGRMTIHKKVPQFLMLDSYRIIQIMLNLVRNAVRFTDKGNVRISVSWIENDNITNETFEPLPFGPDEGVFEKNRGVEALMRSSSKNDVYNDPNSPFHVLDFVTKKIVLQPNNSNDINMRFRRPQRGILKIIDRKSVV